MRLDLLFKLVECCSGKFMRAARQIHAYQVPSRDVARLQIVLAYLNTIYVRLVDHDGQVFGTQKWAGNCRWMIFRGRSPGQNCQKPQKEKKPHRLQTAYPGE